MKFCTNNQGSNFGDTLTSVAGVMVFLASDSIAK